MILAKQEWCFVQDLQAVIAAVHFQTSNMMTVLTHYHCGKLQPVAFFFIRLRPVAADLPLCLHAVILVLTLVVSHAVAYILHTENIYKVLVNTLLCLICLMLLLFFGLLPGQGHRSRSSGLQVLI